jgi:hypothetical protein
MYVESTVLESWNPRRQSSIHSDPRQIPNWNLDGPCSLTDSKLESEEERYVYGKLIDEILESGAPILSP